jgi:hypothetical protein
LIQIGLHDCPHCQATAAWIDLIGALDFAVRRFELWKLEGGIPRDQFTKIVASYRQRRQTLVEAAQYGQAIPGDSGLPSQTECWSCRAPITLNAKRCAKCNAPQNAPEVRLLRYQTFLCSEIRRLTDAGLLSHEQWQTFLTETPERQIELLARLEKGWVL